ncbi:MAG TPA: nitrate reductase associated protein [Chryseosolibacter sp.]
MNTLTAETFFAFEADFVEDNVRCIPMIVRFKLDSCGIKLKLKEWSHMTAAEREQLALLPCHTADEIGHYKNTLLAFIRKYTGESGTEIPVMINPPWAITDEIPYPLQEKLKEFNWAISIRQWLQLSELQRFALLKLSYPGHENRNFPLAMREFNLC